MMIMLFIIVILQSGYREGECVVHCKYCGYSSSNVMFCDSCHRAFPDDIKIEPLIKKGRTCVSVKENETNVAIDKRTFYGQKLAEQSQPYQSNIVHITSAPPTGSRYRMVRISSARKKPAMPGECTQYLVICIYVKCFKSSCNKVELYN